MKTISSKDILDRLKEALLIDTDTELADCLGIKKATLSNWRNRNSIDLPLVFSICEQINIDWLITGEGTMLRDVAKPDTITAPIKLISTNKSTEEATEKFKTVSKRTPGAIPLVSEQAVGGFSNEHFSIRESSVLAYYVIPKFRYLKVDFMIEMVGDSMIPRFYPGDIIACSIIYQPNFIQWNKPHLIATREQGLIVKRLRKSSREDCLLAVSDNRDYEPFDLPKDEIAGLAIIVGVIHVD